MGGSKLGGVTSLEIFNMVLGMVEASDNAKDLCRNIVHSSFLNDVGRGAHIFTLNERSNLVALASYGDLYVDEAKEISAWSEDLVAKSVRSKTQVFEAGDPLSGRASTLCIPYMKNSLPIGACVILLAPEVAESPFPSEVVPSISKLGAFFLETRGMSPTNNPFPSGRESIDDLTTRQLTILRLMGDGLTNAEISTKVLLSESTVRQETIRIYRALAVAGRIEAVSKGRALGLIPAIGIHSPIQQRDSDDQ